MPNNGPKHVVMVGGGFAGMICTLKFASRHPPLRITGPGVG